MWSMLWAMTGITIIKIYIEKIYDNDQDVFITKNSLQMKGLRNFFQYNIVDL